MIYIYIYIYIYSKSRSLRQTNRLIIHRYSANRHIYEVIYGIQSTYIDKSDYKTNYLQIIICMRTIHIVLIGIIYPIPWVPYYSILSVYL